LASETGYRVRDGAGADKSGLLAADTTQWTETAAILPNTQYSRHIHAINDCGESDPSAGQTARTLSAPPEAGSCLPSTNNPEVGQEVIWTAADGFGPGTVQYYRYAWDRTPGHDWTGSEPVWSSGTITTLPSGPGAWYLHVQGYNADDVENGSYDYGITAGGDLAAADFDGDGDVDQDDFGRFQACLNDPLDPITEPQCQAADLDGDSHVDQDDFVIFQQCLSGPDVPAQAGCGV